MELATLIWALLGPFLLIALGFWSYRQERLYQSLIWVGVTLYKKHARRCALILELTGVAAAAYSASAFWDGSASDVELVAYSALICGIGSLAGLAYLIHVSPQLRADD